MQGPPPPPRHTCVHSPCPPGPCPLGQMEEATACAANALKAWRDVPVLQRVRVFFKYAASRSTTGTPHFLVNGAPVDDVLGDGSASSWAAILDALTAPQSQFASSVHVPARPATFHHEGRAAVRAA